LALRRWRGKGVDRPAISAKFHNGMAEVIAAGCGAIRELLREEGFEIFVYHQVPTNDGDISLGRALVANAVTQRTQRS